MSTEVLDTEVAYSPERVFRACARVALEHRWALAAWSLPRSSDWQVLLSTATERSAAVEILDGTEPGFYLHPFSPDSERPGRFLPADVVYNSFHRDFQTRGRTPETERVLDAVQTAVNTSTGAEPEFYTQTLRSTVHARNQKDLYVRWVSQAVRTIRETDLEKVVLARTYLTMDEVHPIPFFLTLRKLYPHAFISLISTPQTGTWIGASPELLMAVNDIHQFRTVSLAGTEPVTEDRRPVSWTGKEFEEQEIVSRYILRRIRSIGIGQVHVEGPYTHQAGNVYHLRTDITGSLQSPGKRVQPSELVSILHPTPAVCGRPQKLALDFIRETEPFQRRFYAGFLGPVGFQGETQLYVNLRCLQLLDDLAVVYAGAGITSESDPEAEWAETTLKCETLLRGLHV
ncbi:MAG: isochorismate synthase [Candidatus Neomarinimicrobiota bacterium]|nr:MAG: isochorismate synthase [Candidatus Neomarinimicrobiota bacterium]